MKRLHPAERETVLRWNCAVLAGISTVGLYRFFDINAAYAFSNSILAVFFFAAAWLLFRKTLGRCSGRLTVISVTVGFLFALFTYVGLHITKHDTAGTYTLRALLLLLSEVPLFSAATALVLTAAERLPTAERSPLQKRGGSVRAFLIAWALIFLAWLPILAASYPGVYGYDAIWQVQYYQNGVLDAAHPPVHTVLLGFFVDTLGGLLGSCERGMCLYSLFQMLCMSATFAYLFVFMRRRRVAPLLTYAALLLFMLLPTNAIMAISSTKDVLYSALFALTVAAVCRIVEDETVLKQPRFLIAFSAVCFGQIIFRSQGRYIYLFMMAVLFIAFRRQWRSLAVSLLAVAVLFGVYTGPVFDALHCETKEGRSLQEMMSVPCMQLARAALTNAEQLSEEELELIEAYVPDYKMYTVRPAISDQVKRTFNAAKLKESPTEFVRLWIKVGLKSPQAYIDAWAKLSAGLWYPDAGYPNPEAYHPYWEYRCTAASWAEKGYTVVERTTPQSLQWLAALCESLTYEGSYRKLPLVSLLFSSGLPFWLLILYGAYCVYRRAYRLLVPALVLLALWGTLLLGPVVLYRYIYPMVMSIPVLLAALTAVRTGQKEEVSV